MHLAVTIEGTCVQTALLRPKYYAAHHTLGAHARRATHLVMLQCCLQAETRVQLADYKGTAAAYEQAMAVAPSIDLLQNLAAAYVNDGKPQAAIDAVKQAGQHLPSSQEELVTTGYGESELSLLLGRIYAQWPGHDGQALDVYDKLIQKNPDDFRQVLVVKPVAA